MFPCMNLIFTHPCNSTKKFYLEMDLKQLQWSMAYSLTKKRIKGSETSINCVSHNGFCPLILMMRVEKKESVPSIVAHTIDDIHLFTVIHRLGQCPFTCPVAFDRRGFFLCPIPTVSDLQKIYQMQFRYPFQRMSSKLSIPQVQALN